ncbi:putative plasmid maintenance toxin/cell growth inhibitor [Stanieria cyanosphaera PCC 7437]|uniref:Plasmid maintenance toxin/cell growth inhibitor n=1 Tax=Stanieria cyanosphaera (strain ATCC 29371 / PCC 7437) TaxID=111780 RepID=K9XRX1_STAC7|nr:type II toxin-antitoxin system PemK/MazF family toxin [Stanieria cyanosphaera]AFZ35355.1 putative plasmid maintenance toxin/cell growth inhibitor [Stanieria cyanosphaera PCC 7437]
MMSKPQPGEIWLVRFPFSDLTSAKLRPALILAVHREEVIILGIFSKIPAGVLHNSWVLIQDSDAQFLQTGLKKTSLIRADKIATVSISVFKRKLGYLSIDLLVKVQKALKNVLNLA